MSYLILSKIIHENFDLLASNGHKCVMGHLVLHVYPTQNNKI